MDAATPSDDPVDLMTPAPVDVVAEPAPAPVVEAAPAPAVAPAAAYKPEKGEFIVLVETPANGQGNAIASTKDRAEYWMLDNDAKLEKRMEGRRRQFFYARHRSDREGIKLGKYAPYQEGW